MIFRQRRTALYCGLFGRTPESELDCQASFLVVRGFRSTYRTTGLPILRLTLTVDIRRQPCALSTPRISLGNTETATRAFKDRMDMQASYIYVDDVREGYCGSLSHSFPLAGRMLLLWAVWLNS